MQISLAILFVASLAFTTTQAQEEKGILRVPITRKSRPDPIISAMQKRNHALTKRDPFLASLYNDQGSQYLIDISVGTPPQNFSVTLDTGSADLWIPGSACPTSECPNGVFTETQSSTYKSLSQPFTLTYGIGSVNGTYVTDTVSVAGATVQNQQFGLASSTQQILTNTNTITITQDSKKSTTNSNKYKKLAVSSATPIANGILGLGYPKLTAASSKGLGAYNPFIFNLATQNIIAQPVFSVFMNSATQKDWSGEIIFGGIDNTKFSGNLTYMPVVPLSHTTKSKKRDIKVSTSDYYWMVYGQGVSVGDTASKNNTVDITFPTSGAFIIDTGTTLTYLPADMAKRVVTAAVGTDGYTTDAASGTYIVDCNAVSSTATFVLNMAASSDMNAPPITFSIPMSHLVIPLDGNSRSASNYCLFGIAPSSSVGVGQNMYLVGDSVLRSAYLVFDMGNNRIGFAAANGGQGAVDGQSASLAENHAALSFHHNIIYTVGALAVTASIMLAL